MLALSQEMQMIEQMIAYLTLMVGTPYIWGGNNPLKGFDCSGLICEGLRSVGAIKADLGSQELFNHFKSKGARSQLARGSLLFFGQSQNNITHVAIALDEKVMLEAGGGDRNCLTINDAILKNAFVRFRPISNRSDLVATLKIEGVL